MMLSYVPVSMGAFVMVLVYLCGVACFCGMAYLCGVLMIYMCVVGFGGEEVNESKEVSVCGKQIFVNLVERGPLGLLLLDEVGVGIGASMFSPFFGIIVGLHPKDLNVGEVIGLESTLVY